MKVSLIVIIILLMPLSGCRDSAEQPLVGVDGTPAVNFDIVGENELDSDGKPLRELSRDEMVIRNCYLTRDAAEEWSRENGGGFPDGPWSDTNSEGHTLLDLLPGGDYFPNPYYPSHRCEPSTNNSGYPGATTYLSYREDGFGLPVGYLIRGWGEEGQLVQLALNWPDSLMALDSLVVANCRKVQLAAVRFASENGGIFPSDRGDETPLGKTMIDFLPGGRALCNPYTTARTQPVFMAAATCGQTGYIPIAIGGVNAGYCITAVGGVPGVTIKTICKWPGAPNPDRPPKVTAQKKEL